MNVQMSPYLANKILDHTLHHVSYTSPASVYLGLFLSDPCGPGGGLEASGTGYARQSIVFGAAVGGVSSNTTEIDFPTAGSDWGGVTYFAILDAATSGNLLYCGLADVSLDVVSTTTVKVPVGRIQIKIPIQ